jgi:hypothetical protein
MNYRQIRLVRYVTPGMDVWRALHDLSFFKDDGFFKFQGSWVGFFSTLPTVTSKKSIVLLWITKIISFCKGPV